MQKCTFYTVYSSDLIWEKYSRFLAIKLIVIIQSVQAVVRNGL